MSDRPAMEVQENTGGLTCKQLWGMDRHPQDQLNDDPSLVTFDGLMNLNDNYGGETRANARRELFRRYGFREAPAHRARDVRLRELRNELESVANRNRARAGIVGKVANRDVLDALAMAYAAIVEKIDAILNPAAGPQEWT